jgi:hypothetical protein
VLRWSWPKHEVCLGTPQEVDLEEIFNSVPDTKAKSYIVQDDAVSMPADKMTLDPGVSADPGHYPVRTGAAEIDSAAAVHGARAALQHLRLEVPTVEHASRTHDQRVHDS